jgi:16S rRNA (cytosine1402-N4)-methyltransferase
MPVCGCGAKELVKILTGRPVTASEDEVKRNPRSRSAKLRVAEKK